jgi:imidazolonepropionase-like amidohydrolase
VRQIRASDVYSEEQASTFLEVPNDLTKAIQEHGDRLLLGADSPQIFNPPGFATHRELALLVKAGLTPYQAIKTGTVNVGRYLGETDENGKIAPGFRADLILLRSNPLEGIPFHDAISGVVYRGYISGEELDDLLNSIRELMVKYF